MLSLSNIAHEYGGRPVLDIAEFSLAEGEVSALVGANGCGKSTLLRILALLETPTGGFVSFGGDPVVAEAKRRQYRGKITLVEQRPFLFKGSVLSNLEYALRLGDPLSSNRKSKAREALARLEISHLGIKSSDELSEGEKQIVAIARATALKPDVFLLDEPTSAADRSTAMRIHQLLAEEASRGASVLFTSHQLPEAFRWANILSAMQNGKITDAAPENIFRCNIPVAEAGTRTIRVGKVDLQVVTALNGERTLAIPAEDIVLSKAPFQSSARNQLTGKVISIRDDGPVGVSVVVDAGIDITARITLQSLKEMEISLASEVVLAVKATAIQVF